MESERPPETLHPGWRLKLPSNINTLISNWECSIPTTPILLKAPDPSKIFVIPPAPNDKPAKGSSNAPARENVLQYLYTNYFSLPNKIPEIHQAAFDNNPQFIAPTETWLSSDISNLEMHIPGYTITRQDFRGWRAGCVFVYHDIFFPPSLLKAASSTTADCPCLVVSISCLESSCKW